MKQLLEFNATKLSVSLDAIITNKSNDDFKGRANKLHGVKSVPFTVEKGKRLIFTVNGVLKRLITN